MCALARPSAPIYERVEVSLEDNRFWSLAKWCDKPHLPCWEGRGRLAIMRPRRTQ